MIFFKQSIVDRRLIYQQLAKDDFNSIEKFDEYCNEVWKILYNFIFINSDDKEKKYRTRSDIFKYINECFD